MTTRDSRDSSDVVNNCGGSRSWPLGTAREFSIAGAIESGIFFSKKTAPKFVYVSEPIGATDSRQDSCAGLGGGSKPINSPAQPGTAPIPLGIAAAAKGAIHRLDDDSTGTINIERVAGVGVIVLIAQSPQGCGGRRSFLRLYGYVFNITTNYCKETPRVCRTLNVT